MRVITKGLAENKAEKNNTFGGRLNDNNSQAVLAAKPFLQWKKKGFFVGIIKFN